MEKSVKQYVSPRVAEALGKLGWEFSYFMDANWVMAAGGEGTAVGVDEETFAELEILMDTEPLLLVGEPKWIVRVVIEGLLEGQI